METDGWITAGYYGHAVEIQVPPGWVSERPSVSWSGVATSWTGTSPPALIPAVDPEIVPDEFTLSLLRSDLLKIITPGGRWTIDVGWLPESDPAGRFCVVVMDSVQGVLDREETRSSDDAVAYARRAIARVASELGDLVIETKDGGRSWVTEHGDPASSITGFLSIGRRICCRAPAGMTRGSGVSRVTAPWSHVVADLSPDEEAEHKTALEAVKAKRWRAKERATKLLVENLSRSQRAEFLEHGTFHIDGSSGRRYRVLRGNYQNLSVFENGVETASLCVHAMGVPAEDTMLMQKLMLESETHEKELLAAANWFPPRGPEVTVRSNGTAGVVIRTRPDGSAALVAMVNGRRVPLTGEHKVVPYSFDDMTEIEAACVVIDGIVAPLMPE